MGGKALAIRKLIAQYEKAWKYIKIAFQLEEFAGKV